MFMDYYNTWPQSSAVLSILSISSGLYKTQIESLRNLTTRESTIMLLKPLSRNHQLVKHFIFKIFPRHTDKVKALCVPAFAVSLCRLGATQHLTSVQWKENFLLRLNSGKLEDRCSSVKLLLVLGRNKNHCVWKESIHRYKESKFATWTVTKLSQNVLQHEQKAQ